GREVEGPSVRSGSAAQRDPLSLMGSAGPPRRVQAGSVHDVRGSDAGHAAHVHGALCAGADRLRRPAGWRWNGGPAAPSRAEPRPTKRYNALGILEDIADDAPAPAGTDEDMDIGPAETPTQEVATTRADPAVVGLGRQKSLTPQAPAGVPCVSGGNAA